MLARIILKRCAMAATLAATWTLLAGGCVVEVDGGGRNGGGDDGGGGTDGQVVIRIINETAETLDPEIFISDVPVNNNQLFQAENQFTEFGVGTRGLLGDFDSDMVTFSCEEVRVVGTRGGRFGDNLNDPEGVGNQRVLVQDVAFNCGDRITLRYGRSGDTFFTRVEVD